MPSGQVCPTITHSDSVTYLAPFVYAPSIDGSARTYPVIEYSLEGENVDYQLRPVVKYGGTPMYSMNNGGFLYSTVEDGGRFTVCIIRIQSAGG